MRISKRIKNIIITNIKKSFGNVKIILFESRTDDSKRGGDFDIALFQI